MPTVHTYLTFDGNCEEAFTFYKSAFGGEFSDFNRYKEMPPQEGMPPVSKEQGEKIMHISLPISEETKLMACDTGPMSPPFVRGNHAAISINSADLEESRRLFRSLSEGGQVTMPFEKTFWGAYFGMFTDKFGVQWMMNCEA